jgi:hypothetical protein
VGRPPYFLRAESAASAQAWLQGITQAAKALRDGQGGERASTNEDDML